MSDDSKDLFLPPLHDFQFTDQQWSKIIKPLAEATVTSADRHKLTEIVRNHAWDRLSPRFSPARARKRFVRIATAAGELRDSLEDGQKERGDSFADERLARATLAGNFQGRDGYFLLIFTWIDFADRLASLQKAALQEAKLYEGRKGPPANIKVARNSTFERLAKIYLVITGKRPTVTVGTDSANDGRDAGKAIGPFVDFVRAVMDSIPDEKTPKGHEIREFLRRRKRKGKRASKMS